MIGKIQNKRKSPAGVDRQGFSLELDARLELATS
jgi:hypothetical protein